MNETLNKLDKYFLNYNKITANTDYEVFDIDAKELITVQRIDLVVKYYYIQCRENNKNLAFARELYEKHIEAFTDGTFLEHGNNHKNSIDRYIEVFHNLIEEFKKNGFEPNISIIPIGKNYELLDGAHRVACAAYFNQKVRVIRFPAISVDYGIRFFKWRLLDDCYIDFIVREYAALKNTIHLLIAWPQITENRKLDVIQEMLENNQCKVIYRKRLRFSRDELWNLIFQIYKNEHWIGNSKNNFKGITLKTDLCYAQKGEVEIYILDSSSLELLNKAKEKIRDFFSIGKSSIHTTDSKKETMSILMFIFDKNCNRLLNHSVQQYKSLKCSRIRSFARKIRYAYRVTINGTKRLLGKPV
jgi:hypothetical protein